MDNHRIDDRKTSMVIEHVSHWAVDERNLVVERVQDRASGYGSERFEGEHNFRRDHGNVIDSIYHTTLIPTEKVVNTREYGYVSSLMNERLDDQEPLRVRHKHRACNSRRQRKPETPVWWLVGIYGLGVEMTAWIKNKKRENMTSYRHGVKS